MRKDHQLMNCFSVKHSGLCAIDHAEFEYQSLSSNVTFPRNQVSTIQKKPLNVSFFIISYYRAHQVAYKTIVLYILYRFF